MVLTRVNIFTQKKSYDNRQYCNNNLKKYIPQLLSSNYDFRVGRWFEMCKLMFYIKLVSSVYSIKVKS